MLGVGTLYCLATHAYFLALGHVSAVTTSLLLYLTLAGNRPGRRQLGAIIFTLLGLGLVVGLPGPADHDVLGLSAEVVAAALYGLYLLASERWLGSVPPLASTASPTCRSARRCISACWIV